jgi:hypothetical protein
MGDVLKVVDELEHDAVPEERVQRIGGQRPGDENPVDDDGRPPLFNRQRLERSFLAIPDGSVKEETSLLRRVDRAEAPIHIGEFPPRVVLFDHLQERRKAAEFRGIAFRRISLQA